MTLHNYDMFKDMALLQKAIRENEDDFLYVDFKIGSDTYCVKMSIEKY